MTRWIVSLLLAFFALTAQAKTAPVVPHIISGLVYTLCGETVVIMWLESSEQKFTVLSLVEHRRTPEQWAQDLKNLKDAKAAGFQVETLELQPGCQKT